MATEKEVSSWYEIYEQEILKDKLGINLNNPKDAERLRVPTLDGKKTQPLFENGFNFTFAEKQKLYDYAKNGTLFAFSKKDDLAYQLTEDDTYSFEEDEKKKEQAVPFSKKLGYGVASVVGAPVRYVFGLTGRTLNLLTLGLFENQIDGLGRGLNMMIGAWSERLFSVQAQQEEKENRVGFFERIGNKLTLGTYRKEKIEALDREKEYSHSRDLIRDAVGSERNYWKEENEKEKEERLKEQSKSKVEKEIGRTEEKINEITQPEIITEADNDQSVQESGKEMKSKLKQQYEAMRMAFGPDGGGFTEAINLARNMNALIDRLKKDQNLLSQSGMNLEKLNEFSNMCTNMEKVGVEGLNAKKDLMIIDKCGQLSPQEKEQKVCQMQLMNMVENAMVNSAYAGYLNNNGATEKLGFNVRSSYLFNAMSKDPLVFENELYKGIKQLESTEKLTEMTPEEIAEFVAEPEKIRSSLKVDISKTKENVKEPKQMEKETEQLHKKEDERVLA